jgi:REP element-mobilizing transposase RayT
MTRNLRQDPIEGRLHVTNHAVGSENLVVKDRDRYELIRRISEASGTHDIVVVVYCLTWNHFRLAVHCPKQGLLTFMHQLESIYAREFNMRHRRGEALFKAQFGNTMVPDDGQARATVRYVHSDPLEVCGANVRQHRGCVPRPKMGRVADAGACTSLTRCGLDKRCGR